MSGVNKAILIGHLGRDPELRYTTSGKPVATFSLATSESGRDKVTGERKDRAEWHTVVVFNENLCALVEQDCHKGSKIVIAQGLTPREAAGVRRG